MLSQVDEILEKNIRKNFIKMNKILVYKSVYYDERKVYCSILHIS